MGTLVAVHRYPVKSMLGETLTGVAVTHAGLAGDRTHAVLDDDGAVGSVKHPRKWGRLLWCRGRSGEDGTVEVALPDGTRFPAEDPELGARLSKLLGRQVSVSADASAGARLERAVPEYEGGVPDAVRESAFVDGTGTEVTVGRVAPGTFFDFGKVHLVTTSSLARLRAVHPDGDFDPRRFRPNLVVDTGEGQDFVEDTWVGRRVRVGEALCRVVVPTPAAWSPPSARTASGPTPASCAPSHANTGHPSSTWAGSHASASIWTSSNRAWSARATRSRRRTDRRGVFRTGATAD